MKTGETIRIIVLFIVGAVFMFLVQPWIYESRIIELDIRKIPSWIGNYYMTGALIVFWVSVFSTGVWCAIAAISKAHRGGELDKWRKVWWLIGLLPVLSIFVAVGIFNGSDNAVLSLTLFFILDVLWLFWFTTATSTPGLFKFLPPLAYQLRDLIGAR